MSAVHAHTARRGRMHSMSHNARYWSATVTVAVVLMLTLAPFTAALDSVADADDLGRGWGSDIHWRSLDDAHTEAKVMRKPIMMVVWQTWCGACKALKPKFAASSEIAALSRDFVMVNVQGPEEPKGPEFAPDGGYIPRILFLDSAGTVQPSLTNPQGNPKYKYYYSSASQVVTGMSSAAAHFSAAQHVGANGDEL